MFHTPTRPVMYIPEYNAVLIPAGARGGGRPQGMMVKPAQPPRRRRPLVDLIRYMQGKTSGEVDEEGYVRFATQDVSEGMSQKEHDELLDKMRQLVSMGVVDSIQIISRPKNDEKGETVQENTKDGNKTEKVNNQGEEKVKQENIERRSNDPKLSFIHLNDKQKSNPIHSQLFQRETKYPADHSRGYHFSYKYVIPHNHNNVAQVSVQQRSSPVHKQAFMNTNPTQLPPLPFFTGFERQVPLPRVIERKSSVPLQMIDMKKVENLKKEEPLKELEVKPEVTNSPKNTTSGVTQAIPITNYHSPRPEIQQAIKFDKIPKQPTVPVPASREESLKKDEQKGLLQNFGLQQEEKKEDTQQEKRVSVKFDNKNGGLSEIKVNTRVKPSSDSELDSKDGLSLSALQDVPLVQVQTHTRKQTVNIMDSNFDKRTADAMKIGFLMGSVQGDKDPEPEVYPTDDDGASPRVFLREALPEDGVLGNNMMILTGKKPSELILSPVARTVAGPKGVAIAAPVAKAYVRGGEEVMLQFDPEAVAIAGPGGRAHSHPRLIVTYMEDKPK